MPRILFSETFLDDFETVHSLRMRDKIRTLLAMIERFPESGSPLVTSHYASRYPGQVRKLVAGNYDLIYTYDKETNCIRLRNLVSQRRIH